MSQGGFLQRRSEALHGSAHSQECLACLSLPLEGPGKTNTFTSSFARINKPWSSLEVKGNWAAFCFNFGRALLRVRISCNEVRKFPKSQVLHRALCELAMLEMCCTRSSKPPLFILSVAFPWTVCKCTQDFLWRTLQLLSWLRQTWEWADDLAVLSAFRVLCSSLPLVHFCPQWNVSAFSYAVSQPKGSKTPVFSRNMSITAEMWCYILDFTDISSGVILRGDGGNASSCLHHESTQHRIIDPSHLAITEQDLKLWTSHCLALVVWLTELFPWMAILAERLILVIWTSSPFRHKWFHKPVEQAAQHLNEPVNISMNHHEFSLVISC